MSTPVKGRLEVQEGSLKGSAVEFMFNPTEYSISKSNTWNTKANKGGNVPQLEFAGGEPRQMTLELFFDTYLPRRGVSEKDLRKQTNQLFNFMMTDDALKGKNSKMGRPPKCRLVWGEDTKNQFECYIVSCQTKFLMFNEAGVPVRATAALTLKEVRDPKQLLPTNPTSLGEPGRRTWVVHEGDRIDWIAYQEYGDAREWRRIADANRLPDPLRLAPGQVLAIPPL
jgi:hypothetical protein